MPKGVYERTPEMRAKWADNMRRNRASHGWPASAHTPEKQAARVSPEDRAQRWPEWRAANPEKAAEASRNAGRVSTAQRWKCDDCGFISHAMGVARHQRAKDHHGGRTRIDTNTEEPA
jgi:hypothetical protein